MNKKQKEKQNFLVGLGIFIFFGAIIYYIIFTDTEEYIDIFKSFCNLNDAFTSALVFLGFIFAFIIYLANQKKLPSKDILLIIDNIPDFLPFKHSIQSYFKKFIKKEYKIIVLLRTLDKKNYEWVLNQISAYNTIMNNYYQLNEKQDNIEFLFVNKYTDEIKTLVQELNTNQYNYILISSLSAIFKDTILAREELSEEEKANIQILGALSSINDDDIQKIIDNDDKIIRIFPPDYDEAKTAMEFLFSKIKNSICPNERCDFHHKNSNIIIVHNGTYGRAVRNQCEFYFNQEFHKLNLNTASTISDTSLDRSINFYSFDYTSKEQLIYDKTNSESFDSFLETWRGADNYFYIIGYEPNISHILNVLDVKFENYQELEFHLLFSGTTTMRRWRREIVSTLKSSKHLSKALTDKSYYLNLNSINQRNLSRPKTTLKLPLKQYRPKEENIEIDIYEVMTNLFKESKHINEVHNIIESFLNDNNNYIITFTTDSIHIALYTIKHGTDLIVSKYRVLQEQGRRTDILVNGDSINQYIIKKLH